MSTCHLCLQMQGGSTLQLPEGAEVPKNEKAVLVDHRSSRKIMIGSIDRKKTAQLQKRNKRKQLEIIRKSKHAKTEEDDASIKLIVLI